MSQTYKDFKHAGAFVSFEDKDAPKSEYGLDDTNQVGLCCNTKEDYPDNGFFLELDEWEDFKAFVDKAIADNKDGLL